MDPVPDPLLLRKSGSAGNRTQDLCICSQKLRPLDHRGGLKYTESRKNVTIQFSEVCGAAMMGEVLPAFSSNVLPSPTNCLTPRPLSLSEMFRHTTLAAKGHIPEDRCGYLNSRKFTLSCSPSTRPAASPDMAHDVTTTDGRSWHC